MRLAALCLLLLLSAAAPAAEEPDAVYAKYHRAAASGDVNELMRYVPEAQRIEMARMSTAQRDAAAKMSATSGPRAYVLRQKTMAPDGRIARLVVSGESTIPGREVNETLYGSIRMILEGGEWKVADEAWTNTPPAILQAEPAKAPKAAAQKAAGPASKASTAPVGSLDSAPEKKLGKQKQECVYKPVMSAEDLENCR